MTKRDVKSAIRVLEIFELFSEHRKPLRQKDIIDELDYPQSSATILLKSLTSRGYLRYDLNNRQYFPTLRLSQISSWISSVVDDDLTHLLRELQHQTNETAFIALQNDINVQYVKIINSNQEIRFNVRTGSMRLLTEASAGWMLLSRLPPEEVNRILWRINQTRSQDDLIDIREFSRKIDALRNQDHCYVPNLPMLGGGSLSMMIARHYRDIDMVVGVGAPTVRLEQNFDKIRQALRELVMRYDGNGPTLT
ncbi:IclR family transcriptional regulator [Novosphingobium malaysiense]|uniref:IclR family transcriptional regulator n=1 Tax=Novosphingobium malaysiense TaxID=1348853 RepID=A0A0B1ZGV8_9SPHN|nr:helix-turn-helix domain-containing protein [Novosphingobium malaysiense]KHK90336.1 hypothetical protein LK12_17145 [Novosphingobium malaysiense]